MRASIERATKSWLTFLKCLSVILNGKRLRKMFWFRFYPLKTHTNLSVSNFVLENQYLKTDLQSSGFKQTLRPGWGLLSREQQTETTDTKSLTRPTTIFLTKIKEFHFLPCVSTQRHRTAAVSALVNTPDRIWRPALCAVGGGWQCCSPLMRRQRGTREHWKAGKGQSEKGLLGAFRRQGVTLLSEERGEEERRSEEAHQKRRRRMHVKTLNTERGRNRARRVKKKQLTSYSC